MEEVVGYQHNPCNKHYKPIVKICRSHFCNYYNELCEECCQQDQEHQKAHLKFEEAVNEALRVGSMSLKGLQAVRERKNQQMQVNINNNPGLFQIESKLKDIRDMINEKIDNFNNNIKRIYEQHVNQKLQQLDEVISKSQQLLQRQLGRLQENDYSNLKLFFRKDFIYELNYYQSYFNEIFVKKIRNFKTALQNDRILTLITAFEQNLQKIFTFSKQNMRTDNKLFQFHLFNNQLGQCFLYSFNQDLQSIQKHSVSSMNRITHNMQNKQNIPENTTYKWEGIPQSIFYPTGNCYYIIGEGLKPSKLIVKYQYLKGVEEGFCTVKSMETDRCQFGTCLLNGQIYIIGGQNQKEGCLSRCQKFVPLYNNQVYIIHSLKQRSSRHSITTYKDKFILKFGGIRRIINPDVEMTAEYSRECLAYPEIYSLETEEWSIIAFNQTKIHFNIMPGIFKLEQRNFLLILGGDPLIASQHSKRPAFQVTLDQNKGKIQQMKVRVRQSKISYKQKIYNSTIALQDDQHICVFLKSQLQEDGFELGRFKIQL